MEFKFSMNGKYEKDQGGLKITLNNEEIKLGSSELIYLLRSVDVEATSNPETPPLHIGFMLNGKLYITSNQIWSAFVDALEKAALDGGWFADRPE